MPLAPGKNTGGVTSGSFISEIRKFIGDAYVYGAEGPTTFDCSGLVQYALAQLGIDAPRTSEAQYGWVDKIDRSDLQIGDLVFMQFPGDNASPGHVEIYVGKGNVLGADDPAQGVAITSLASVQSNIVGYGRVPGMSYDGKVAPLTTGSQGSGGGASTWDTIWSGIMAGLNFSSTQPGSPVAAIAGAGEVTDATEQGLLALSAPFIKVAEGLDWLFHPSHWVRIFAGVGGGILVIGGTFQMFHTGGEIPVSAYGVSTSVGIPRAASLPLGILLTGVGGLLLFVAFHNLPDTVTDFPSFLGHLTDEIHGQKAAA